MGRTFRHRRKKLDSTRPQPLGSETDYVQLVKWLSAQTWSPTCKLAPALFTQTGRGMVAKENISSNSILASLPASILITVRTVANSELSKVFINPELSFSTQQVLSAFLVYQKHLGLDSHWLPYLNILPNQYSSPVFCSEEVISAFPETTANKIYRMKAKIDELYLSLVEAMADKLCDHCDKPYCNIFSFEKFQWAWFTVNSRSVFLSPSVNDPCDINLIDSNSLALAPFLDMINHTDSAKVNVLYDDKNRLYSIQTLVPYKKNDEVFINYGGHSNEKLFLEYGFILPENRNDSVSFTQDEFLQALKTVIPHLDVPKNRYNLLKSHGFLSNLSCSHEGLSWNARALLHVLFEPCTVDIGEILKVIYSSAFRLPEKEMMTSILSELFSHKMNSYSRRVDVLKELSGRYASQSFTINTGMTLLIKYVEILKKNLDP